MSCDKDNRLLHCERLTDVARSGSPVCMGPKDLLLPESLYDQETAGRQSMNVLEPRDIMLSASFLTACL